MHCKFNCNTLLTDWFARKNIDNMVIFVTIFITGMNQVRLITNNIGTNQVRWITNNIVPLQSGSVFYERAKLTGVQYKTSSLFLLFIWSK